MAVIAALDAGAITTVTSAPIDVLTARAILRVRIGSTRTAHTGGRDVTLIGRWTDCPRVADALIAIITGRTVDAGVTG